MKAGKLFYHEEAIEEDMEGLQIFIRPKEKDSEPEVIFKELDMQDSVNQWRLIASPDSLTKIQLSSDTWIYDMKITPGGNFSLPEDPRKNFSYLLYVFQGVVTVNNEIVMEKGESLFIEDENVHFITDKEAEIVLFVTDKQAAYYNDGMYSGNRR